MYFSVNGVEKTYTVLGGGGKANDSSLLKVGKRDPI